MFDSEYHSGELETVSEGFMVFTWDAIHMFGVNQRSDGLRRRRIIPRR